MLQVLAPVSMLTTSPTLVVTRSDSRFTDMKKLLAEAKAKPGTVTLGHSGNGTTNHVGILRLQLNEQVKFNVIPYRGSGRASPTSWPATSTALPISSPVRCRISSRASYGRW
jgi:tripartite-type tricarboxylate transporter receptor subunit TctC